MRSVWILGLTIGLAACAAPSAFTFASLAIDGFSYVTTGKGVGDHALSMAMRQDCAMFRALTEGSLTSVCLELDGSDGPTAIASNDPGLIGGDSRIAMARSVDDAAPVVTPVSFNATAFNNHKATYLVAGSFRSVDNAKRRVDRLAKTPVRMASTVVDGKLFHRVLMGPFADADMANARVRATDAGVDTAWTIDLCTADLAAPPCGAPTKVAQWPAPLNLAANDAAPPGSID